MRATMATNAIRSPCSPAVLCVASCNQPGICKKNIKDCKCFDGTVDINLNVDSLAVHGDNEFLPILQAYRGAHVAPSGTK